MTAAAYAAIYLIWGSTFLAIGLAVRSIPPLLMMGVRCSAAGILLLAWAAARREPSAPRDWAHAAVAGTLMFAGAYGTLAWAEQEVASGIAALLLRDDAVLAGGVRVVRRLAAEPADDGGPGARPRGRGAARRRRHLSAAARRADRGDSRRHVRVGCRITLRTAAAGAFVARVVGGDVARRGGRRPAPCLVGHARAGGIQSAQRVGGVGCRACLSRRVRLARRLYRLLVPAARCAAVARGDICVRRIR